MITFNAFLIEHRAGTLAIFPKDIRDILFRHDLGNETEVTVVNKQQVIRDVGKQYNVYTPIDDDTYTAYIVQNGPDFELFWVAGDYDDFQGDPEGDDMKVLTVVMNRHRKIINKKVFLDRLSRASKVYEIFDDHKRFVKGSQRRANRRLSLPNTISAKSWQMKADLDLKGGVNGPYSGSTVHNMQTYKRAIEAAKKIKGIRF